MRAIALLAATILLAGCAATPETQIRTPLTARPQPAAPRADSNGAIFQAAASQARPGMGLFEDRRAKRVGDILTVNLVEKTEAKRKSETTDERKANGSIDIPSPTVLGRSSSLLGATSWDPSASNKIELKDNETNTNEVKGSITVTVVEVLANGNLLVAGEKQVRVNQDTEYIRLAGVVNPNQITAGNTVNSTQMADVQLESTNSQKFDKSQMAGMLARFFLTILPF
ncbi:MAG: flagellar basal body L-ring protein FlgH [Thiobacillus sp.]|nr:flagellar basal body L-ring protein FlgH [Thiobacillus sp.]